MSNVTRQINLDLDVYQLPNPNQVVIDADTGERLQFYRANSLDFSITFGDGSGDFDMSSVTKVSLEVKQPSCSISPPRPLAPLQMNKEVEGPFATGAPVVISFDRDETAIRDGVNWMSVTLYGAANERMTTVSGTVFVLGNGYGAANVPDVQDLRDRAVQAAVDAEAARDIAIDEANRSESEADRAQGIADNLQAVAEALSYRGGWSSSTAPAGAQRGYFWVVDTAATWAGITWAVGDAALYNGSTWSRVALDWLLAQANANIDALRQQIDRTKAARGGVHFSFGSPSAQVPITATDLAILNGFTFELVAKVTEYGAASSINRSLFGSLRGITSYHTGGVGLTYSSTGAVGIACEENSTTIRVAATSSVYPLGAVFHCIGEYDATTGIAKITTSDGEEASANWGAINLTSIRPFTLMRAATNNPTGNDDARSVAGTVYKAAIYNRILTPEEKQELFASGGQITPLSARGDCIIDLQMNEGTGYQLRDSLGNGRNALLTETGCTHLIPDEGTPISAEGVNASSATYFIRGGAILPVNSVVVGAIVDGEYLPAEGAQNLTHDRIRLNPSGGDLQVQRSNGTTHQTLATFTPASLASVNVTIIYRLIK